MSQVGQGAGSPQPSIGSSPPPVSTGQLLALYDEFAELVALNNFLYDALLSLSAEADSGLSTHSASGLGVTCRWLRQRQHQLKDEFYQLIQRSKVVDNAVAVKGK